VTGWKAPDPRPPAELVLSPTIRRTCEEYKG
jgi:hypothetical protein